MTNGWPTQGSSKKELEGTAELRSLTLIDKGGIMQSLKFPPNFSDCLRAELAVTEIIVDNNY